MEYGDGLVSPHLNADMFKASASLAARRPPHHDFLRLHQEGAAMLGSSDLKGRFWIGAVKVSDSVEELQPNMGCESPSATLQEIIPLESGVTDGCFLTCPNKVLLTEDSGGLTVWHKSTNGDWNSMWSKVFEAEEHDDSILAVQCLQPDQNYITVGADCHIKLWDLPDMICMKTYRSAHGAMINDVSVKTNSTSVFATASMDYSAALWDKNCEKRVKVLHKCDCGVRCVSWLDESRLLVGDEAGRVSLVDTRNASAPVRVHLFNFPVHRICVNNNTNNVGICCDSQIVSVFDASVDNSLKLLLEDRTVHKDLVRGAAWDTEDARVLHSVSRDGILASHTIS